ncbi:MAG TPA: four helix bundle protein [Pyrinomonadaceae bacterium]|nr:four helix bundle protein [Pyrinomonadaceae bacterium]
MATFKRFEDIVAWQKSRVLAKVVYQVSGNGPFDKDYDFRRQIRRSSISVMANIAEGQGRRTDKDFAHFLNISLGSVAETKSHLYLALDLEYVCQEDFDRIYEMLDEIGRMVFSLVSHLRLDK